MIFHTSKNTLLDSQFFFKVGEVDITTSYTLGFQFTNPRVSMWITPLPQLNMGYGSLSILEHQCFDMHSLDIPSKMHLFDRIIKPTVFYGAKAWGPNPLPVDWACVEKVQFIML
jgi:hypothetical protein